MKEFSVALRDLINTHSLENGSDTPDFVLTGFLMDCLRAFNIATQRRDKFYNFDTESERDPQQGKEVTPAVLLRRIETLEAAVGDLDESHTAHVTARKLHGLTPFSK